MAKQTNVNISTVGADIGYGISALMTLLLANGWTLVSAGTGTAGVRRTTPALSLAEWIAATNTWQIVARGSVWLTIKRNSATSIDVRFAVAAPATVGSSTVADSQVTAANETAITALGIAGSTRAHAITVDSDDNATGIRSFYLIFTTAAFAVSGAIAFSALANGTYATANPAPYVVAAVSDGSIFSAASGGWRYWYSPTSIWTTANPFGVINNGSSHFGVVTPAGVDPWNGKDVAFPAAWSRLQNATQPGFLGVSVSVLAGSVLRNYPNTTDLATDARVYVGTTNGNCLIPWADGVVPL